MKKQVCEVCGSTSFKKIDDNTFECQNCGFVISTTCINTGSGLSDVSDSTIVQSEPTDVHSVDNELHKEISDNDEGFCDVDFSESTSENEDETVFDNSNISEEAIYENSESTSVDDNLPNAISAIGFADNFGAESINIKTKKSSKEIAVVRILYVVLVIVSVIIGILIKFSPIIPDNPQYGVENNVDYEDTSKHYLLDYCPTFDEYYNFYKLFYSVDKTVQDNSSDVYTFTIAHGNDLITLKSSNSKKRISEISIISTKASPENNTAWLFDALLGYTGFIPGGFTSSADILTALRSQNIQYSSLGSYYEFTYKGVTYHFEYLDSIEIPMWHISAKIDETYHPSAEDVKAQIKISQAIKMKNNDKSISIDPDNYKSYSSKQNENSETTLPTWTGNSGIILSRLTGDAETTLSRLTGNLETTSPKETENPENNTLKTIACIRANDGYAKMFEFPVYNSDYNKYDLLKIIPPNTRYDLGESSEIMVDGQNGYTAYGNMYPCYEYCILKLPDNVSAVNILNHVPYANASNDDIEIIGTIPDGTVFNMKKPKSYYTQITYNGVTGYIATEYLVAMYYIQAGNKSIRIYNEPLPSYGFTDIICNIPNGSKVDIVEYNSNGGWTKVKYNGQTGWVPTRFLE